MEYLFDYTGQERDARELLIDEKIASIEDVAIMSGEDVEEKIRERYEVVAKAGEEILLVKKEDRSNLRNWLKFSPDDKSSMTIFMKFLFGKDEV